MTEFELARNIDASRMTCLASQIMMLSKTDNPHVLREFAQKIAHHLVEFAHEYMKNDQGGSDYFPDFVERIWDAIDDP